MVRPDCPHATRIKVRQLVGWRTPGCDRLAAIGQALTRRLFRGLLGSAERPRAPGAAAQLVGCRERLYASRTTGEVMTKYHIVALGGPGSGKTVYMAALYHMITTDQLAPGIRMKSSLASTS